MQHFFNLKVSQCLKISLRHYLRVYLLWRQANTLSTLQPAIIHAPGTWIQRLSCTAARPRLYWPLWLEAAAGSLDEPSEAGNVPLRHPWVRLQIICFLAVNKGPVLFGSSAVVAHVGFERVHKEGVESILDKLYREFSTRPPEKRKSSWLILKSLKPLKFESPESDSKRSAVWSLNSTQHLKHKRMYSLGGFFMMNFIYIITFHWRAGSAWRGDILSFL